VELALTLEGVHQFAPKNANANLNHVEGSRAVIDLGLTSELVNYVAPKNPHLNL